ncbi:MAG TPA: bifunctional 4-hydroxy-2-oxoglutarate aldolase/2-dehydro-3-deoxy-phosphogluconate aldolase [Steroidobacteraceae bacterium]|jgi:2-dehydro-3-deoxyphosphogluconate aldolase/(4S)-4-hydroxy-2-oxoglutarate aldolase|nr:bifunctional 4-hydroxy-2-oxoglutarate aldolase/2-dehydro-3-deoxy-phosphogluconate aldolase [Steroidobacteraceae bacterium]
MKRTNLLSILRRAPVIPVLTIARLEYAVPLGRALVQGGLPVLEVTLRSACAIAAIEALRRELPEATVGAGTLLNPEDFTAAAAAGAQFGVTPGLTPTLVQAAGGAPFPLLPGVMTPSELIAARAAGFGACKLFPAQQAGGVAMLRALAGPFPDQLFCPTGGVTPDNAAQYLSLPNVPCVGGSWLAPPAAIEARDFDAIERLAREASALRPALAR